jgi:predicted AlkP superfamily pyrophosphatase or phosphodiesterase
MPRIKALTTGSVPSFADLIFNLDESGGAGASLAAQDTWLAQIRARGGKLVFYGDDTWLRLFPGDFFERADGTSSFFVSVSRTGPVSIVERIYRLSMNFFRFNRISMRLIPMSPVMFRKSWGRGIGMR